MLIFFTSVSLNAELFINEFMAANVLAWANTEGGDEDCTQINNFGNGPVQSSPRYTESVTGTDLFQSLAETHCELITPSQVPPGQRLPVVARIRDRQWQFDPIENNPLQVSFGGVRSDTTLPIKRGAGVMNVPISSNSNFMLGLESPTVPSTEKNIQVSTKPVQTYTGTLPTGDVIWDASADRQISGILTVPTGCRLIIQPGTWVIFQDRAGMTVHGEIQSQGTEKDPIVLTSADWNKPWGGIEMVGAQSSFRYSFFLNAGGDLSKGWAHTGRDSEANVDGFELGHGTQHDFVFNRCTTYNVYDGFDISSRNSTLNRCLAYNCWNGAYKLWADQVTLVNCIGYNCSESVVELDWDEEPGTTTLMNCTFYNGQTYTIRIENALDGLNMTNCILSGGDNIGLLFEQTEIENYHGDYNVFQNDNSERGIVAGYQDEFSMTQIETGAWTTYSGQDAHSLVVDSDADLFVNPGQADFRLLSECEAVDHGTGTGAPANDYEGNTRPSGSGYVIGAYEYQSGTGVLGPINGNSPESCLLSQNYPNPFNPSTTIAFELPKAPFASLIIYNILGEEVAELVSQELQSGTYQYVWQAMGLPSGVYFYKLETNNFIETRKMLLLQ